MTNTAPPTSQKELQKCIGVMNYYYNMWPRQSHTLSLLTKLRSNIRNCKWTEVEQYVFDEIKRILARNILLTYPDFNETFMTYTNASAFQLGAVISQKGKTIAFYSIKITDSQQRYTVTERELLSIAEILKEFITILLGHKL